MSRSKRKTPRIGNCSSTGQHKFKMKESRAKRRKIKVKLVQEDYANLPHDKEYGNEWASPRDGKHWVRNIDYKILKK